MRRFGIHDSFEKWDILCRYWADPAAVPEIGTDKWNRPLLAKWHDAAVARGLRFGREYLASRLEAPRPRAAADFAGDPAAATAPGIEAEIAELSARLGPAGLHASFHRLGETITTSGFTAPFDGDLSPRLAERMRQVFKQGALDGLRWTGDDGELPTLPLLRSNAPEFPVDALRHKSNVLSIFCCRFYGRSDVIHIHDARPDAVTLVDNDAPAMADMKLIYPSHWDYVTGDYKEFLAAAVEAGHSYDFIIADQWVNMAREVAWEFLPTIMKLCSDTFITNYRDEMFAELNLRPDDLAGLSEAISAKTGTEIAFTQVIPRSKPAYWAVMRNMSRKARADAADIPVREATVIGPTGRWSDVSPEGSLNHEVDAPVLTHPRSGATTGPSPRLQCGFLRQDFGEPIAIIVQISGDNGIANFRFNVGSLRQVNLRRLGIALPAGEAKAWALYRRSPDVPWATHHRVDFRVDPAVPDDPNIV